jgi:hypothetical protein
MHRHAHERYLLADRDTARWEAQRARAESAAPSWAAHATAAAMPTAQHGAPGRRGAANVMAAPSPTAQHGVVTAAAAHDDANDAHDDANDARRGGRGLISAARAAHALIRTDRSARP